MLRFMNFNNLNKEEFMSRVNELMDYTDREIARKQQIIDDSRDKIRNIINEIKQLRSQRDAIAFLVEGKDFRQNYNQQKFFPEFLRTDGKVRLQEAIFQIVKRESGPEGLTIGDISHHLDTRGIKTSKNRYNVVYTSCIRLFRDDKLDKVDKDGNVAFRLKKEVQTPL